MGENFTIPLNGLAAGETVFSWHADKEFFERFDNSEILQAQFDARASVEKSGQYIGVDCNVQGQVTVECDRCLGELVLPVDVKIMLSVKYGENEVSDDLSEGEREVVAVSADSAELDMAQIIYDYVCLSLPMQRVHAPGGCDPAAMKYLEGGDAQDGEAADSPFGMLKDLLG